MELVPLIPKPKVLPNLEVVSLVRELFQEEFQIDVPSKKLSHNLLTSLQYERSNRKEDETFRSVDYLESLTKRKDVLIDFSENVFEAYAAHEKKLNDIRAAEKNILENQVCYLKREDIITEDKTIQDLLSLKRQPLYKALDENYVNQFKLLQGEAGLPPQYKAKSDFQVKNYQNWRKRLESISKDSLIMGYMNRGPVSLCDERLEMMERKESPLKKVARLRKPRPKIENIEGKHVEVFRAEPKIVFFTGYKPGDIYVAEIQIKNVHKKKMEFQLKPMCPGGPFTVSFTDTTATRLFPGLSVRLTVEFAPKSMESISEDIYIAIEDGYKLLIPLVANTEPPVLKTHRNIDEFTQSAKEKIAGSIIECGPCFTGDSKVAKLRFQCYGGSGEFFVMSAENWYRCHINSMTLENLLEIPPFRVYPVFFKMDLNEVIDFFVEFLPKTSGTHVENIVIACNNGEFRILDILGDAVGWHSYYISFQHSLLKDFSVSEDDDFKVKYFMDFEDMAPTGKAEKTFQVFNNSSIRFEFQWKIREANIKPFNEKYLKLSKHQVKIDPEGGTLEPNSGCEFLVTVSFSNAEIGNYRIVFSLYILNLPYQCIEEDNTIIQPTGLVRNLYSQSLYSEEDSKAISPEIVSLQGTYESLQESIKSYVECQSKVSTVPKSDFCRTTCIPNPSLCAKPLKKSKTFLRIGNTTDDEDLTCVCRSKPTERETISECDISITKDEKNESAVEVSQFVWDFVDVLADELEVSVEVSPTRVTIEPNVVEISKTLSANDSYYFKEIRVINHNRFPAVCNWLVSENSYSRDSPKLQNKNQPSLCFLYGKTQETNIKESESVSSDRSIKEDQKYRNCVISVEPNKPFMVNGHSDLKCKVGVLALKAGAIQETLWLVVNNGDLTLQVNVYGNVTEKSVTVSPETLDFGILKRGTRASQEFKITNSSSSPLTCHIEQYIFDFKEESFSNCIDTEDIEKLEELCLESGKFMKKPYYINAKVPGMKLSILEIKPLQPSNDCKYVLVLGDVKHPVLTLSAPRFENAILAPSKMMYVGQEQTLKVILTNRSEVDTVFTWGHPFGCHSRKISVHFSPKHCEIKKKEKLVIDVKLTPLDEGLINHCYVPCFFCRSQEPLILSIVGVAEKIKVTFEIIDYPLQTHADVKTFLKTPYYHTVLRVPWPIKIYDPTLGKKYLSEENILNMKCHCLEVEEEASRAFGLNDTDLIESEKSFSNKLEISDDMHLKSKETSLAESAFYEDIKQSVQFDTISVDQKSPHRKSPDQNSIQKLASSEPSIEALQYVKSQVEFLQVPFRTPCSRQFVIRNETTVPSSFQIRACSFGAHLNVTENRVMSIKNKVLKGLEDEFRWHLPKEQPLLITVKPSKGELQPLDAVCINVTAYGTTWGEYRDILVCQIKGIEPFHLKLFVQIVGHPIHFPMFDNQTDFTPTLRFQPISHISPPVTKKIKVVNRSSIPLTVSWIVFLTYPLPKDNESQNSVSHCSESNLNGNSNQSGEESAQSTKIYIPKNASESGSAFQNMLGMRDFSQNSGTVNSFAKTEPSESKSENKELKDLETSVTNSIEGEGKSDSQQFPFPGGLDAYFFQVEPKEISFEPYEEKIMTVTFDPHFCKSQETRQEFRGLLTACIKLKPEDEKCNGLYTRSCGMKFLSEVLNFNAMVEASRVSLEILKGDLKFLVDANAVLKSPQKKLKISRTFLIRNKNQKEVFLKIKIVPGIIFNVKSINTIDKIYKNCNFEKNGFKIEPGQVFQMELECEITYREITFSYEGIKRERRKCLGPCDDSLTSDLSKSEAEDGEENKEPWHQFNAFLKKRNQLEINRKDVLEINRVSSESGQSICYPRNYFNETEGEYLDLGFEEEIPCKPIQCPHKAVAKEDISFVQTGLLTQTLTAELHLSFSSVKINPKNLNFGNVYVKETSIRYFSLINLTGFPTEFKIKGKCVANDFVAKPSAGILPPAKYNSDIGTTIAVEFKPPSVGYFKKVFLIYFGPDMEFDHDEVFVCGFGSSNEKFKFSKFAACMY